MEGFGVFLFFVFFLLVVVCPLAAFVPALIGIGSCIGVLKYGNKYDLMQRVGTWVVLVLSVLMFIGSIICFVEAI